MKSLLASLFAIMIAACLICARPASAQSGGTMGGGTQAGMGNGMRGGMMEGGRARLRAIRRARREACSSKSAGTACTFVRDGHDISGTCQPANDGQMACRNVVGRPGVFHHGPPASGMSAGDLPEQ